MSLRPTANSKTSSREGVTEQPARASSPSDYGDESIIPYLIYCDCPGAPTSATVTHNLPKRSLPNRSYSLSSHSSVSSTDVTSTSRPPQGMASILSRPGQIDEPRSLPLLCARSSQGREASCRRLKGPPQSSRLEGSTHKGQVSALGTDISEKGHHTVTDVTRRRLCYSSGGWQKLTCQCMRVLAVPGKQRWSNELQSSEGSRFYDWRIRHYPSSEDPKCCHSFPRICCRCVQRLTFSQPACCARPRLWPASRLPGYSGGCGSDCKKRSLEVLSRLRRINVSWLRGQGRLSSRTTPVSLFSPLGTTVNQVVRCFQVFILQQTGSLFLHVSHVGLMRVHDSTEPFYFQTGGDWRLSSHRPHWNILTFAFHAILVLYI